MLKSNNELARLIFLYLPKLQASRPNSDDWSEEIEPSPLIIPSILSNWFLFKDNSSSSRGKLSACQL